MAKDKILRVRLSDEEWKRLKSFVHSKGYTLTEVIRNYQKASGKPLALAMGMNMVVALATLKKLNIFVLYSRSK